MMRLKAKVIEKFPSEIAKGKTEPTSKMGHKDNVFAFIVYRRRFAAG